ncbi:Fe(3+) ABC transporter substrate-binding protein [Minwuia sp.]|uniref:Fe(3+) ABC transporter substrate-binding protein n=1 Tax=Minwuia sp. TaxID=2493630 RepID=UPI003A8E544C
MKSTIRTSVLGLTMAAGMAALIPAVASAAEEVNLYSYRQPFLMQPLTDAFTEETGIKVNMVYANKGLLERLKAEGANTPADVVITTNAGRLNDLVEEDLVQSVSSDTLNERVPANLRDPEGRWFAITKRGRIIYASRDRVPGDMALSYADLADPKWKGKICTRSGKHGYTIDLVAAMIARHGEDWTENWLKGLKANLARKPQGNDRAQIKGVASGECDLAIGNTYYYGVMLSDPEQKGAAEQVRPVFPDQSGEGAHMNISGAAVTKHAQNRENAVKLIEFLAGPTAQGIYAAQNYEFPVLEDAKLHPIVEGFGDFKEDAIQVDKIGRERVNAAKLVDKVNFDG